MTKRTGGFARKAANGALATVMSLALACMQVPAVAGAAYAATGGSAADGAGSTLAALADESEYETRSVSTYDDLVAAMEEASADTSSTVYKVTVAAGTYSVTEPLYLPSNVYIVATGATFVQSSSNSGQMLKTGDDYDTCLSATGYAFDNITIEGGTWDMNACSLTLLMVCHASNVTLSGVTFTNTYNSHLVETAGVSNLTFEDCTFSDQNLDSSGEATLTYEAIQLDILQEDHLMGYASEDLTSTGITITGCTFVDVPRGVGSHTAILNNPISDVTITNNTFTDTRSSAIQLSGITDAVVSGNTITGAPTGITALSYSMRGTYLASDLGSSTSSTSTSYKTPSDYNITIKNNTITLDDDDDPFETSVVRCGIILKGIELTSATNSGGSTIPKGNYYLTGVTVSNNTIKTAGYGIRLTDARNSTLSGNTVTYTQSDSNSYVGISLVETSTKNTVKNNTVNKFYNGIRLATDASAKSITGNTVKNSDYHGICLTETTATSIDDNTVSTAGKHGIIVTGDGASATSITGNEVSSAAEHGIIVTAGATAGTIASNTVSDAGTVGIYTYDGAKVTTIDGNTVSSTGKNGIGVNSATVTTISNNTVTNAGNVGIAVLEKSKVTTVSGNTVSGSTAQGIFVQIIAANITVKKNTVSDASTYLISCAPQSTTYTIKIMNNTLTGKSKKYIGVFAGTGKITLSGNTIKNCSQAVKFATAVKGTIYKNTLSGNTTNKYAIGNKQYGNMKAPTLKVKKRTKSTVKLKWAKVSGASGYVIYRATSESGTYKKKATVTAKTYTDKKLKSKKTYYYKAYAYRTVGKTKFCSSYGTVKKATTK